MDKSYYVYEHIRLDNMTCFYVGKGKGDRAYIKTRNKHHDRIVDKCGYLIAIVANNLSEEEAHWLERDLIEEYVFDYGYSIDTKGNKRNTDKIHLTNATFGGDGCSGRIASKETREKLSKASKGRLNSEYSKMINRMKHLGKIHTQESKDKIGLASIGRNSGSDNWNAKKVICLNNKEIFETITDACKKYNLHVSNMVECCKHINNRKFVGILNQEHLTWLYYDEYENSTKEEIKIILEQGLKKKNHQSHKIICITLNRIFNSIEDGKNFCNMKSGSSIGSCCKGKIATAGQYNGERLKWMYYSEYKKVVNV